MLTPNNNTIKDNLENISFGVMSGLKDFQRATVERIYTQFENKVNRILVADEVGLGKTLIARGVVAKFAQLRLKEGDDLVKVVYICSNAAIAGQNLEKLSIDDRIVPDAAGESRLSMQHLKIFRTDNETAVKQNYIQLIPLTPDTSFRMTSGAGTANERALMYVFLRDLPEFKELQKELRLLMTATASQQTMNYYISIYGDENGNYDNNVNNVDKACDGKYKTYMTEKLEYYLHEKDAQGNSLFDSLIDACKRLTDTNANVGKEDRKLIGRLRVVFAEISLEKLEPDIVIMDEFQRFQSLLDAENDPDSELGMLINKFFRTGADKDKEPRILLLSATPFKMYSTLEELDESAEDTSYKEFLHVMSFLNRGKVNFKTVWSNYTHKLKEARIGDFTAIITSKNDAEQAMYDNVCRTERISANLAHEAKIMDDLIDASDVKNFLHIDEADIRSYLDARNAIYLAGMNMTVPIDYIKSTPYLFSFMNSHYAFKRYFEKRFRYTSKNLSRMNKPYLWLKRKDIAFYKKIPFNNARLERVNQKVFQLDTQDTVGKKNGFKAELLLWVPPTLPYYKGEGVYKNADNFTKTLIFSSWEMVPKMLACMLSYEAERKTIGALDKVKNFRNLPAEQQREISPYFDQRKTFAGAPLRFEIKNGKISGYNLFCLLYPSASLAEAYQPIECLNRNLSLSEIKNVVKQNIKLIIQKSPYRKVIAELNKTAFYLVPLLLDKSGYVDNWFCYMKQQQSVSIDEEDEDAKDKQKAFQEAITGLENIYREKRASSCPQDFIYEPSEEILNVLADIAIASPSVCCLRTYNIYKKKYASDFTNDLPTVFARKFINKINIPESRAIIELAIGKKSNETRWRDILTYCANGNFQAMLDEYAHLVSTGKKNDKDLVNNIHRSILQSMVIRSSRYRIDTFNRFKRQISVKGDRAQDTATEEATSALRTNFAVAFTKGVGDKDADRKTTMRNAFNSPFRPFVLASTSIGQEGLDFHYYCRRIVHWNLPSNPIDIEQREGRINRFECLAIRANVANSYKDNLSKNLQFKTDDLWNEMFLQAETDAKKEISNCSDLLPFWGVRNGQAIVKIERIVPMYPYSKDVLKYDRMINILTLYRLALGQPRQEELLEYVFSQIESEDDKKKLQNIFFNLSPFYKL